MKRLETNFLNKGDVIVPEYLQNII